VITCASSGSSRGSWGGSTRRPPYDGRYRVTAAFLAYLVEKYDKDIVRKLNRAMREGRYEEGIFQQITGKTVRELDEEWRATLRP
jgi:Peptidase of plants and bacteria